ncbi:unnamed protein product [Rhizoctonia solani]|uniref:Fungal-type protein kinase domain-containing protein n=1 Tax=Rhizoctonia solani TaxID=456999 RepID=A0A8H3A107_9AGAM|nr:unnamed protein product [Rhizoctonia solani]
MRLEMDDSLHDEVRGQIYCDPNFISNFLAVEKRIWPLLDNQLRRLSKTRTVLAGTRTAEHRLYQPILGVLQSIKNAVDTVRTTRKLGVLGVNFCDTHDTVIPGIGSDTRLLKPDLILFEDHSPDRRRWSTVMMAVEVKAKHTYLKVGMKQLARYARVLYTNQIHRRHLYGMVVCKSAATFVRFDRSGMVYSEPIDMLHNPKEFRKAFAGLMMLDRSAFGYDTAFTTEYTSGGLLRFYVDLPASAFSSDDTLQDLEPVVTFGGDSVQQSPALRQLPARRFKVIERLSYRNRIHGPGTIVLRLREVRKRAALPESESPAIGRITRSRTRLQQLQRSEAGWEEVPGGHEYVLKLAWRESDDRREGDMLNRLEGEYGVVQCQWYSDILQWGASCHKPGATSCDQCCDMTSAQKVRRVKNLEDLDVEVVEEQEGVEPQHVEVEVNCCVGELDTYRTARIYTWILFSTVGRPLQSAESPRQFLEAVLDAVLGYWQAYNLGILHRDISYGNVLLADPGQGYKSRKWKFWQDSMVQHSQQTPGAQSHPLAESRRLAHKAIMELGRDPVGFLTDFDMATTHSGVESETFGHVPCSRTSSTGATLDIEPLKKRPRLGDDTSHLASTSSASVSEEADRSNECPSSTVSRLKEKTYKPTNFPTGTPPFMSIRVSQAKPGVTFEHSFMDDLESFFWLILWCVAEHTDPGSNEEGNTNQRTKRALAILRKLDRADSDFMSMSDSKCGFLLSCITSEDHPIHSMKRDLQSCQNTWASNPAIVDVVLNLGTHFFKMGFEGGSVSPLVQFPTIVGIISKALQRLQ